MSKTDDIIEAIKSSHYPNFDKIAKEHGTTRKKVVDTYSEIRYELKIKTKTELDAPKFWNPEDEIKTK